MKFRDEDIAISHFSRLFLYIWPVFWRMHSIAATARIRSKYVCQNDALHSSENESARVGARETNSFSQMNWKFFVCVSAVSWPIQFTTFIGLACECTLQKARVYFVFAINLQCSVPSGKWKLNTAEVFAFCLFFCCCISHVSWKPMPKSSIHKNKWSSAWKKATTPSTFTFYAF